ncbi:Fe-S cluster assembly ATPase SufC [archaeon CG10_big_fil_rev_8_21_14_0_10_43_11]|nr:MAG: Fe-S cluster assembly ATPase SufC [archaeon CG10_big_fil_rev_8_21_14_0_10_43_11]
MSLLFEIKNLHVNVGSKPVLSGVSLTINKGEFHTIMGPNGSGKSTLAKTIMGHPDYIVVSGEIFFKGKNILDLSTDERARLGIFLGFQQPVDVDGVVFSNLLFQIAKKRGYDKSIFDFRKELKTDLSKVGFELDLLNREVNKGLSGGEKKRAEVLQLLSQKPSFVILDEIDSGLDVDTMRNLASTVNELRKEHLSGLVITHYNRLLSHLKTDFVHILKNGKIIKSGGPEIAKQIEEEGYAGILA